jgi:hypothetical protein
MKKIIILFVLAFPMMAIGQDNATSFSKMDVGIGLGMDYGGIGGRLTYLPIQKLGLFGALGYNLESVGYNVGAVYKFMPDNKFCPTFSAMYGYNAVIIVEGASAYNETYYGPSISMGVEWKAGKKIKNIWNLEVVIPFRSQEFNDDWDAIKDNPNFDVKRDVFPLGFSVGYHFGF